jgi:hypothetical protein
MCCVAHGFFLGLWRQSAFASAAKLFAQVSDVADVEL